MLVCKTYLFFLFMCHIHIQHLCEWIHAWPKQNLATIAYTAMQNQTKLKWLTVRRNKQHFLSWNINLKRTWKQGQKNFAIEELICKRSSVGKTHGLLVSVVDLVGIRMEVFTASTFSSSNIKQLWRISPNISILWGWKRGADETRSEENEIRGRLRLTLWLLQKEGTNLSIQPATHRARGAFVWVKDTSVSQKG